MLKQRNVYGYVLLENAVAFILFSLTLSMFINCRVKDSVIKKTLMDHLSLV